jgi:drug/metabolite transporter (DMT)-like permease
MLAENREPDAGPFTYRELVGEQAGAKVWGALWIVYVVWGSTYLAIRVGVQPSHGTGLPPLLMAAARFTFAGLLMLALFARRPAPDGAPDPMGWKQWSAAVVIGCALLLGGNGLVSIAEKRIPSGIAAVLVATVPTWAALLGAVFGLERVTIRHAAGLALGFVGVAILVVGHGGGRIDAVGVVTVVIAALSWAAGSVWATRAPTVRRPLVMTGMEMVGGGLGCAIAGLIRGEAADFHPAAVPTRSWVALAYLVVFGSMVAYTAYVWLLHNARLSLVTTYTYVNPLVAVALGAIILSESLSLRTGLASAAIVLGVMLIIRRPSRRAEPAAVEMREPESIAG